MARNETFSFDKGVATQMTNANTRSVRVQNECNFDILLKATVGAVPPTDWSGALRLRPGQVFSGFDNLVEYFEGIVGCNRLYGICIIGQGRVSVSHADA